MTFKASGLAVVPAAEKYAVVGDFNVSVPVFALLGGSGGAKLGNITADATEAPIKAAIAQAIKDKGGTGAINITIIQEPTLIDLLLNYITGTIYSPSTVVITGTVIK
jgi:hypothetical protein